MFVVDAAVLLPHPPHVVARVVERVYTLPRWCTGLRRVRHPPPLLAPPGVAAPVPRECVFTYTAADVRLTLHARTVARGGDRAGGIEHAAEGDGVTLSWAFSLEPEPAGAPAQEAGRAGAGTRLRARTALSVDPDHPTAAVRAALCRQMARRAPTDLERLRALLERYEFGKAHGALVLASDGDVAPSRVVQ